MIHVLFVCLGNICRSPMAEAIFKDYVRLANLEHHFKIDSAGTASYHIGSHPDDRTLLVCEWEGVPIKHAARAVVSNDFNEFDYIIPMDLDNKANLLKMQLASQKSKIVMLGEFESLTQVIEVPDPYYGGTDDFYEVYELLRVHLKQFLDHLIKVHQL